MVAPAQVREWMRETIGPIVTCSDWIAPELGVEVNVQRSGVAPGPLWVVLALEGRQMFVPEVRFQLVGMLNEQGALN